MPKATDHIAEMIELTTTLLDKGLAYEVDGNVYFDVSAFPAYGQLSGQQVEEMRAGHRVDIEPDKHDPEDFALWKRAEPGRLMKWPSPWGDGFPGWHIECSAMSMKYLGERFDIHTGGDRPEVPAPRGRDRAERGDDRSPGGQRLDARRVPDARRRQDGPQRGQRDPRHRPPSKGFQPLDFRYLALTAHYRSKLDFTFDAMQAAAHGLRRLRRAVAEGAGDEFGPDLAAEPMAGYRARFAEAISDDLAMPKAIAVAHAVAAADDLTPAARRALLLDFDRVLGLDLDTRRRTGRSENCPRELQNSSTDARRLGRPRTGQPRTPSARSSRPSAAQSKSAILRRGSRLLRRAQGLEADSHVSVRTAGPLRPAANRGCRAVNVAWRGRAGLRPGAHCHLNLRGGSPPRAAHGERTQREPGTPGSLCRSGYRALITG